MGSRKRAAEAIIAALSVQSASGASTASGSAARSSEFAATPPTTAMRGEPELRRCFARPFDERTHDRVLVARREICTPFLQLGSRQLSHGVEQCGLQSGEGEVEARDPGNGKLVRVVDRPREQHGRARRRPGSRARAGAPPCRRPRLRHRRACCRAHAACPTSLVHRVAACGRRSPAGRETAARAGPARGRGTRRDLADGRRQREEACEPRRSPWPRQLRRATRRSARGLP